MKLLIIILLGACIASGAWAQTTASDLNSKLDQLLKRLHQANDHGDFKTEEYARDLRQIADQAPQSGLAGMFGDAPVKQGIVFMAVKVQKPDITDQVENLKLWYGRYDFEIPLDFIRKYYADQGIGSYRLPASREDAMKRATVSHRIHPLHEEHAKPDYLHACEFWLMAPPSPERELMAGRINQALEKIGDESVIPLVVEALKIDTSRTERDDIRRGTAFAYINLICGMPGEKALDALLDINRYAIENSLNGDDYFKSITRHIVRRLASRRAYADQLIDPTMKETIARQGYNEKPDDIPLTDDLWKEYKPLVAARLKAKNADTPQADIALLEAAQQIMPNE